MDKRFDTLEKNLDKKSEQRDKMLAEVAQRSVNNQMYLRITGIAILLLSMVVLLTSC